MTFPFSGFIKMNFVFSATKEIHLLKAKYIFSFAVVSVKEVANK